MKQIMQDDVFSELVAAIYKGVEMREAQDRYTKSRDGEQLMKARHLELEFDKITKPLLVQLYNGK